jgi:hypothetical protein
LALSPELNERLEELASDEQTGQGKNELKHYLYKVSFSQRIIPELNLPKLIYAYS